MTAFFITGTDTEIGKTLSTCALLRAYAERGLRAIGMKPVAAGCDEAGHNEDVEALIAASSVRAERELVNPYLLKSPIAPHLAAAEEGRVIRFAPIHAALGELRHQADIVLVEGVGGFRVPLGPEGDSADLAQTLGLPVILVVGMRLGCINHALLSVEAIQARGLLLAGWIANHIDAQMLSQQENVQTLRGMIDAPLLGVLPFMAAPDAAQAAALLVPPDPQ